jgi:DNA-binding HxlR family transcriptional regulator
VTKRYDEYCPVAHALGLVGERWALLVVLELMRGPKRYTDLAENLRGIGTNILASRLRDLEAGGVVTKRTLPPPAASKVYELTDYGRELRPVIRELALWGARTLGPPTHEDELFPGWLANALDTVLAPRAPLGRFEFWGRRFPRSSTGRCWTALSRTPTSSSKATPRGCTTCSSSGDSTASASRATAACSRN